MLKFTIKNKNLVRIVHYSVIIYRYLNKYLFLMSIITIILKLFQRFKENKIYKLINSIFKFLILLHIILGAGIFLYYGELNNPLLVFNIYSDLIQPYIDLIKTLWNELIHYFNLEDIKTNINIKEEIKLGVKEGIKEALGEVITELKDDSSFNQPDYIEVLKPLAIVGSVLFLGYFLFYLPGSINPEDLTQYNFINQSLIEFKITVKSSVLNFFSTGTPPTNPGIGPADGNNFISPQISPTNSDMSGSPATELTRYFGSPQISPTNSDMSTITPNTPTQSNINL